jgi:hypothetical protein
MAERDGASLIADPAPLPSGVSAHRLRRGLLRLGGLVAIAVVVVTLAPGLGELRTRFARAQPVWIVVACAFEVLSVLAYVPAFRSVFCRRMSWSTSYKIGVAEEGAGSLFPLGGAGSLALGVWALRRGGMPADEIARKTVAFFLLTSAPSVPAWRRASSPAAAASFSPCSRRLSRRERLPRRSPCAGWQAKRRRGP